MRDDLLQPNAIRAAAELRNLPVFAPDAALWPRIAAEQQRRVRMRRLRGGGFSLAAAAAICAIVIGLPHPLPPQQQALAATQRESQMLEGEWHRLVVPANQTASGLSRLRGIDAALQAAYDRGAEADELAPLWQERNQALRGLIARVQSTGGRDLAAVTRI
jgi:hypothetical protein